MNNEVTKVEDVDFSQFKHLLNPQTANALAVVDTMAGELAEVKKLKLATVEALAVAQFKNQVKHVLGQNIDLVMGLQNSPMGFKTDKKDGYDADKVQECAVVALSYGCHLSGNHFNIIAGNAYITKEGYFYKLSEMVKAGLLEYSIVHGLAEPTDKYEVLWKIKSTVTWKYGRSKQKSQELEFIIKGAGLKKNWQTKQIEVDANNRPTSLTTQDQIRGKADRKVMHFLWCTIMSSHIPDMPEDLDEGDVIEGKVSKPNNLFDEMEKEEQVKNEQNANDEKQEKPKKSRAKKTTEKKVEQSEPVIDVETEKVDTTDGSVEFSQVDDSCFESPDNYVTWLLKRAGKLKINPMLLKDLFVQKGFINDGQLMNSLPVENLIAICKNFEELSKELIPAS